MPRLRNAPALLAAVDSLMALGLAVGAVLWVNARYIPRDDFEQFLLIRITLLNASFSVVFVILWRQCLTLLGLDRCGLGGLRTLLLRSTSACLIMTAVLDLYLQARHARGPIGQIAASFFVAAFLYVTCRALLSTRRPSWHTNEPERVIIVGSGRRASKAWREVRLRQHGTRQLLGFVDDRDAALMPPDIASRLLGTVDDLPAYLLHHVVDEVVVATPLHSCYGLAQRAVSIAEAAGVRVLCLNDVFTLTENRNLRRRTSLFLELAPRDHRRLMDEAAKRVLDVLGASVGLLLLAPVLLLIGWSLALDLKILARTVPAMIKRAGAVD